MNDGMQKSICIEYIFFILLSGLITAGFTWHFRNLYLKYQGEGAGIEVSFTLSYENQNNNHWQIFYRVDDEKMIRSNKPVYTKEKDVFTTMIPCRTLHRFRFDFGNAPGGITLKMLRIRGQETITLKDMKKISSHQLDNLKIHPEGLTACSHNADPFIDCLLAEPLRGRYKIDYWVFSIIAFLSCVVVCAVLKHIFFSPRGLKAFYCPDLLFSILVITLLFIPFPGRDDRKISVNEKRRLADYKPLIADNQVNFNYGKNFESWFNDHFFGRAQLLKLNSLLRSNINFPLHCSDNVYFGRNNWHFYAHPKSMRNYHNLDSIPEQKLSQAKDDLNTIQAVCSKKKKKLYVVIVPEKNKVYGEYYPASEKIRPDSQSRAKQLEYYLKNNTSVPVINLQDTLLANKKQGLLYWKNDTHWNEMGAYIAYLEIMKRIQADYPGLQIFRVKKITIEPATREGDLSSLSNGRCRSFKSDLYPLPHFDSHFKIQGDPINKSPGLSRLINPNGKLKILILRDSFAIFLLPYLGNTFQSTVSIWNGYYLYPSRLKEFHDADIIIFAGTDRFMDLLLTGIHNTRISIEQGVR